MKQKIRKITIISCILIALGIVGIQLFKKANLNTQHSVGDVIDSLNGVKVFYNGGVDHVSERNLTSDNYNLGLKYQCVEFVKRYYYEHLNHKMPDAYGHAKDFFDNKIKDGERNESRDLLQYSNPSSKKPKVDDLVIYSGSILNSYGHVAIVSDVKEDKIEIVQQNPRPFGESRIEIPIRFSDEKWEIKEDRILGWLRKE